MNEIEINFVQNLFIGWNAERLGISRQESERRFAKSWACIPHNSGNFRELITVTHYVLPEEAGK